MIAMLRGRVFAVVDDGVIVDVQGVGYAVQLTSRDVAALSLGQEVELRIYTVVREDALALFGFTTPEALQLFTALISVTGVGPKLGLALLHEHEPAILARALHDGDVQALCRAKGVGKRIAEVLVVQLREKIPPALMRLPTATSGTTAPSAPPAIRDALSALSNLGYRPGEAHAAIEAVLAERPEASANFDGLLRSALGRLRRDGAGASKRTTP